MESQRTLKLSHFNLGETSMFVHVTPLSVSVNKSKKRKKRKKTLVQVTSSLKYRQSKTESQSLLCLLSRGKAETGQRLVATCPFKLVGETCGVPPQIFGIWNFFTYLFYAIFYFIPVIKCSYRHFILSVTCINLILPYPIPQKVNTPPQDSGFLHRHNVITNTCTEHLVAVGMRAASSHNM